MENIHGISFDDWASANAFLAQGKTEEEIFAVLQIEKPQWDDASAHYNDAFKNDTDFTLVTRYGEIFQNPATGKFVSFGGGTNLDDSLAKVPDFETYVKVQSHMSAAAQQGIDAQTFLREEYGLDIYEWSQTSNHWGQYMQQKMDADDPDFVEEYTNLRHKYEQQFNPKDFLSGDIEF